MTKKYMLTNLYFTKIAHIQKAPITASSEKVPDSQFVRGSKYLPKFYSLMCIFF